MIPTSVDLWIARAGGAYVSYVGKLGLLLLVGVLAVAVLMQAARDA